MPPAPLNRRRFVTGLGCAAALGASLKPLAFAQPAAATAPGKPRSESAPDTLFDLTVAPLEFNVTGRVRTATAVNGAVPAPALRCREGDSVTIRVTNHLLEPTSIHWHGLLVPNAWDGVPGLTFRGIDPGETFVYRFAIKQSGTYWYHGHSGMQEQTGLYGPLLIEPRTPPPYAYEREHVVMLSDWTDEDPMTIVSNLKQQSDYYDFQRRTLESLPKDAGALGLRAALADRLTWGKMRMHRTDLMDVNGSTYTFLINGRPPSANCTLLYRAGERLRLRFINASSMTTFDVRIPGLQLAVVQADGSDVQAVSVEEFRIGVAETYDVIVHTDDRPYTIFAQALDRSGYARATLATRAGESAAVPPLDPPPLRTLADMGMAMQGMSSMGANRLGEAGDGLDGNGRRVLTYADLKSLRPTTALGGPVARDIEFHLTGNMERWVWGFDGKKFSEAAPVRVRLGERVRFVLINDTMMEHPIHLHGFLTALENGQGEYLPLKHTVNVKPGERLAYLFTADEPGHWAFHCHLLYHMETGMFRTVLVA